MTVCVCVFWQRGSRRCLREDFPRAVSRAFSQRLFSRVDRRGTYGFVFVCGSNMCTWWGMELPRLGGEYTQAQTFMETHSRRAASRPFTFVLVRTASSLPEGPCCTWRGACRKHFHACMSPRIRTTHRDIHHPSNLSYYLSWFYAADPFSSFGRMKGI